VAEADFFRGTPPLDACAPGIRRDGDPNLRMGVTGLIVRGEFTSDHLQFISFYSDGNRALDRFNGDHKVLLPTLLQNAFQAIQAATANPYFLPNFQESVQGARDFLR
jgi:hypothetical protein